MKKSTKKTATKRKKPTISKKRQAYLKAVGRETKRILEKGGTKTVTKRIYKTSPQKALTQAVKNMKKFY